MQTPTKVITLLEHWFDGYATIEIEKGKDTEKLEVCLVGPSGWHPGKDDVIHIFTTAGQIFAEPFGWQTELSEEDRCSRAKSTMDVVDAKAVPLPKVVQVTNLKVVKKQKKI